MASDDSENEETLNLKSPLVGLDCEPANTQCLLCSCTFILPTDEKKFLSHLFEIHRLVIGDVAKIASIRSYVHYWRVKFQEAPLIQYCTTMLMDCTPNGKPSKNEVYYLLSDCLPEDRTLRDEIQRSKLEMALAQQAIERRDISFKRGCMFCRLEFSGLRSLYLNHLSEKHNVQLGRPENLVFVDKLLDKIQSNIESLKCIYCEKTFKDRNVLKEHMRKKLHKRVNPNNRNYDRFYITNYLEPGSGWRQRQKDIEEDESTGFSSGNEDEENSWADWSGKDDTVICLLCPFKNEQFNVILEHMKLEHSFDFDEITKNLNFYEKVKIVNYLRKQIYDKKCINCDKEFDNVCEHMKNENHGQLPPTRVWNQPEFYFPIYESESFLYHLDCASDDEEDAVVNIANNLNDTSLKD